MKPYYQDSAVTIYHGDCRDVLPSLDRSTDLLLTDPPYGVSGQQNTKNAKRECGRKNAYTIFVDSVEYIRDVVAPVVSHALSTVRRGIITPGNRCVVFYPLPDSFGCFYQPASVGLQPWGRADSQPILYYGKSPRGGRELVSIKCSHVLTESPEVNGHPCPKPLQAWAKLLWCGSLEGETVLDPFMGSGTTLRAAKDLGRKAIGVEIEEKYCEIAARRMAQEGSGLLSIYA